MAPGLFLLILTFALARGLEEDPAWLSLIADKRPDLAEEARIALENAEYDKEYPLDCTNGPNGTEFLVLTNETYHAAVRQCKQMFVLVHVRTADNPFFNGTEAEMQAALLKRRIAGHKITGAVMDLASNMKLARNVGVFGSHGARLYINRIFQTYWGQLLATPLTAFLVRMTEPPLIVLDSRHHLEQFTADKDVKVVAYLAKGSHALLAYELAAKDFLHVINFYVTYNSKLASRLQLSRGTAAVHRPLEAPVTTADLTTVGEFVRQHRRPLLARIRPQDVYLDLQLMGTKPVVFAFLQSATPAGAQLLKAMRELAQSFGARHPEHRAQLRFAWIESLDFPDILPNFMAQFGFNMHERHADVGLIDLRSMPAGALWFPIDRRAITPSNLEAWILRETASGDIKFTYIDRVVPNFFGEERKDDPANSRQDDGKSKDGKDDKDRAGKGKDKKDKKKERKSAKAKDGAKKKAGDQPREEL